MTNVFVWTVGDVIGGLFILAFVLFLGWIWVMDAWDWLVAKWRSR